MNTAENPKTPGPCSIGDRLYAPFTGTTSINEQGLTILNPAPGL